MITVTITLDDKGGVKVDSNVEDRVLVLGLIEVAKDTLNQHFAKASKPLVQAVQPNIPLGLVKG